jgi:hypothetical protein
MLNTVVDVSSIPQTMDKYLGITWGFSILVLPFIFVSSLVYELHKATEGQKPDYRKVIWVTVLIVFSNFVYRIWVMQIIFLCESLGKAVLNYKDWSALVGVLSQKQEEVGLLNLYNISILDVIYSLSLIVATIIEDVFEIIRYLFLCCLYIIGPVTLVCSIYPSLRHIFKRWCIFLLQVSFWIVIFRIFQSVLLDLNSVEIVQNANVSVVLVFSIVFILGCLLTPFFTAKLFEEKNITIFATTVLSGMNLVVKKFATAKVVLSKSGEKMSVLTTAKNMVINTASSVSKAFSKFTTKSKEKFEQQEEKRIR